MKTIHRDYSEESGDFRLLCRFIIDNNAMLRVRGTWSIGRIVDWKYGLYDGKRAYTAFTNQNAHLWFDAFDELVGYAISENGDAGFSITTLEGYRFLFEEMFTWVLQAWGSRKPPMSIELTEHQTMEAAVLERYGFACKETFYTRRFDLTGSLVPRIPLEPGFVVVDMASHPDFRAQRVMRASGFQGRNNLTEEEIDEEMKFYDHSHNGPIYHAATDLCVMAPDGRFVSGCEALIDARNLEADIERVCTHTDFRQRGFARAAIQECLYRLKEMGLRTAYITGYSPAAIALYGSLGAVGEMRCFVYQRG